MGFQRTPHLALLALSSLFAGPTKSEELNSKIPLRIITACIDERPWIPFTNPDLDHPGEMQVLLDKVSRELSVTVAITALPWKRCQESVRSGKIDAMVGAGDVAFNRDFSHFPEHGGKVDPDRSLGAARIMLVRRKGSRVNWNGRSFINLSTPVGVAMGTQVMRSGVLNADARVDEGGKTDAHNLRKLIQKRVDLMAGYEFDLKDLIAHRYQESVEILPIPLIETDYYFAFSNRFYDSQPLLAELVWQKIGTLRTPLIIRPIERLEVSASSTPLFFAPKKLPH